MFEELAVARFGGQELGVGADRGRDPAFEKDDAVGQGDRGEPMSDDEDGSVGGCRAQRGVDPLLHPNVDGAGGIIEPGESRGRGDRAGRPPSKPSGP